MNQIKINKKTEQAPKIDASSFNEPEKEDLTNGIIERKKIAKSQHHKVGTPNESNNRKFLGKASHTSTTNINIK